MILATLVNPIIFQMRRAKSYDFKHSEKAAEKIENAPSFEVIKEKSRDALLKFYQYCKIGEDLTQDEYISAITRFFLSVGSVQAGIAAPESPSSIPPKVSEAGGSQARS